MPCWEMWSMKKEIDAASLPKGGGGRLLNLAQFEGPPAWFSEEFITWWSALPKIIGWEIAALSLCPIWGWLQKKARIKCTCSPIPLKQHLLLGGVTVNLYGANNQLLGTATSNAEGVAEIPYGRRNSTGSNRQWWLPKRRTISTTFLFNNTRINTSRFDVGGKREQSKWLRRIRLCGKRYLPAGRKEMSTFLWSSATENGRRPVMFH